VRGIFASGCAFVVLTGSIVAGLALTASTTAGAKARPGHESTLAVAERDFHISAAASVAAGPVKLVVTNDGPDMHELIVVADTGSALPLNRDGLTVNEAALKPVTAGSLEPAEPGRVRTLRLKLRPGRYIMFCNMAGHELGGMHSVLVVR
jgi:uncharacterized cupredoxin-like copper-binding protein